MHPSPVYLKKHEDKRLRHGHVWIYSNEIDTRKTPLSQFQPGQLIQFVDSQARPLGIGYINPHTLLCARLLTRDINQTIDQAFFARRLQSALALREQLFPKPYYRLVHGEGDALPGVIIDRYGDHLVVQITTAGMEALKPLLLAALQQVVAPQSVLWRNDHGMRQIEALEEYVAPAYGDPPVDVMLEENGVKFCTSIWQGQKTGWFYDHRQSRAELARYVKGRRVLDLFSYIGGWSIQAAVFGASEVWAVDSSADALRRLQHNAALNHVEKRVHTIQGDVFEQLKQLAAQQQRFDVIILDPPAFIKKRKDIPQGLIAYKRLNEMALRLLNPQGFFISASCSQHLSMDELRQVVLNASVKNHGELQILSEGHQGLDHPRHPAIPETDYLKTLFCRVRGDE